MTEKRLTQTLEEIPPVQMPEVLRLASELYAQERTAIERAEERQELLNAANEAGLPPEYLERAAATLQARQDARQAAQQRERPRRRPGPMILVPLVIAGMLLARGVSQIARPPSPPAVTMPAAVVASVPIGPCYEVDLSPYITHRLDESMLTTDSNNLAKLRSGLPLDGTPRRTLNGVQFRLDGAILVGPAESSNGPGTGVPLQPEVNGIRIDRKADRLHFLHGTHWRARDGELIASYIVHYADGTRVEIPVQYGVDVVDWWEKSDRSDEAVRPYLAWVGSNDASANADSTIRLYKKSWENPRPRVKIESLDMVTGHQSPGRSAPAPFLVGLTVEDGIPKPANPKLPSEAEADRQEK